MPAGKITPGGQSERSTLGHRLEHLSVPSVDRDQKEAFWPERLEELSHPAERLEGTQLQFGRKSVGFRSAASHVGSRDSSFLKSQKNANRVIRRPAAMRAGSLDCPLGDVEPRQARR